MKKSLWYALFLMVCNFCIASSLSPTEKKLREFIQHNQREQLVFLEQLVNINSGTMNAEGIKQVGERLETELKALGFKTRWVAPPSAMHRAATLIAERVGKKGKRVLLIGHLDTVFAKEHTFQKFKRNKNTAMGPGVIDMKGGDLVILYALKALHSVHALEDTTITIVLTGDEENSGKPTSISRKPLFDAARHSDIALDFENALTRHSASISRRGVAQWTITSKGHASHSAVIFDQQTGYGAGFELARIINSMRKQFYGKKYITVNPALMIAGSIIEHDAEQARGTTHGQNNVVAKTATATGDFRFLTPKQKKYIERHILKIVNRHLRGTKSVVTFQDGIPSMPPTLNNLKLLQQYSQVSRDLGYGEVKPSPLGIRGAGDISHIASIVPANLAGIGAVGWGAHSSQETLEANFLPAQTERAAVLMFRLTR